MTTLITIVLVLITLLYYVVRIIKKRSNNKLEIAYEDDLSIFTQSKKS